MTTIGRITQEQIVKSLKGLIDDYIEEIDQAYTESDDDLSISLNVKLQPAANQAGATQVVATISFIAQKIKDSIKAIVDEQQQQIFPEET